MTIPKKKVLFFQKRILAWYAENRRDLPWREVPGGTSLGRQDPYRILVSEVMLQQTQVARVIPKYEAWLKKFPTVEILAKAPIKDVLTLWSGLGYNRRALNLQRSAQMLVSEYSENSVGQRIRQSDSQTNRRSESSGFSGRIVWPRDQKTLMTLPGVGEYTARAVLCFAFNQQLAVVDTNVRKVILLEIIKETKGTKEPRGTKEIQAIADQLLPKGKAKEWNQALMDYAAAVLKKEKISIPKQSRFQGSNRYYRGKLLRLLLARGPIGLSSVGKKLKDDFTSKENEWLQEIIDQMEKEGFVRIDGKKVVLIS